MAPPTQIKRRLAHGALAGGRVGSPERGVGRERVSAPGLGRHEAGRRREGRLAAGRLVVGRPRRSPQRSPWSTRARVLSGARGGATGGILVSAAVADTHSPRVAQLGNRRPVRAAAVANEEPAHATVVLAPEEREGLGAEHAHFARVGCPVRRGAPLPLGLRCGGLHQGTGFN